MGRLLGDEKRASHSSGCMTLVWSPESIHDLIALRAYIAEHDPASAKRVALHIIYCVEHLLTKNPKLGAPGRVPVRANLSYPKPRTSSPIACGAERSKSCACTIAPAAGRNGCSCRPPRCRGCPCYNRFRPPPTCAEQREPRFKIAQLSMCGSSCKTTSSNELWITRWPPL
jgi:plasmid stabilization system protein ParE